MKTNKLTILALCALSITCAAKPGGKRPGPPQDTDKDGKISLEEFSVGHDKDEAEKLFNKLDTDSDGYLSKEEMGAAPKGPPKGPPRGPRSQ